METTQLKNKQAQSDAADSKSSKNFVIIISILSLLLLATIIVIIVLAVSSTSDSSDDNKTSSDEALTCFTYSNIEPFENPGFSFNYDECTVSGEYTETQCQQYNDSYSELRQLTTGSLISPIEECYWDPITTTTENKNRIGRMALINETVRVSTLSLIEHGEILDLGYEYSELLSNELQQRYVETSLNVFGESITMNLESNAYGNLGTQFDAVGHVFYKPHDNASINDPSKWIFYNNFRGDMVLDENIANITNLFGVEEIGIENYPPIVSRGILLDLPRALFGNDTLPPSYEVTAADIKTALEYAGIDEIYTGDVIFFYTGWYPKILENLFVNVFIHPYLSPTVVSDYFKDTGIIGIGFDVLPDPALGPPAIHDSWIICQGGIILEFVNLEEWIDNVRNGNDDVPTAAALFYTPWRVVGGVGSPGQPYIMY